MNDSRQISVVITCFNREELVGFAIASAISEFPDAHIIVVDDCSYDASREQICADFSNEMRKGQLALIQRHVNGGVTAAKKHWFPVCSINMGPFPPTQMTSSSPVVEMQSQKP